MRNVAVFGRARHADFALADGIDHLNHGAFGATPRAVLAAAENWRARMEADPSGFFRHDLPGLLRGVAARVAVFLGGQAQDWGLVENATAGLNAIIASLALEPGDEVLCLSQVYGAVRKALEYHAGRAGAHIVTVPLPVPFTDPEPLFTALAVAIGGRTRLAVLDHVTSAGAAVLPVRELAAICRARGVPVAIDGAHAPGMLAFDVPGLGADWYVGNLHKWAFAAKGCAVIWCAPERQAGLHPPAISHYLGQGFAAEFDYCGTRDNSAWLAVPAALDYLEGFGAAAVRRHNDDLAHAAGTMLAESWRSETAAAPAFSAAMCAVRVPGGDAAAAQRLALWLARQHGISVGVTALAGGLWIRISAQIYNEIDDYRRLAELGAVLAAQ